MNTSAHGGAAREPLWLLAEMASGLNTALDLETLHLTLSRHLRWLLAFDRCTFAYAPAAEGHYALYDITDPTRLANAVPQSVAVTDGWCGRVLADGKLRYLPDLSRAEDFPPAAATGLCDEARSLMLLPLLIGERVLGVLCFSAAAPDAFGTEFRNLSGVLAAQVAGRIGAILVHQQTRDTLRELRGSQERLREMAAQLTHQASHDPLTGLVNRREFERRLGDYIASAQKRNETHSLCYIALDHFKRVNDICGHRAGDALLRQVATLTRMQIRETDTLARLDGDKFAVLLPHRGAAAAAGVVAAVRDAIRELRFVWEGEAFTVSGSIGMVEITAASGSVDAVLRAADAACYVAKGHGGDRVSVHTPDDANIATVRGEADWARSVAHALAHDRFCLHAQPVVPLAAGAAGGERFEVLLRMGDEDGGLVPPPMFLPAAERFNLLPAIDRWVIRAAFAACAAIAADADRHLHTCFINLSGASLADDTLLTFIEEQFALHALAPEQICFEVTETAVISRLAVVVPIIDRLRRQGCRFALDDFGSGLSSFMYLKNLPVDYLKVAETFVTGVTRNPIDRVVFAAINDIGHIMGIETIAEGVEDSSTLARLTEIGVDYAQGYGLARPRPLEEMVTSGLDQVTSGEYDQDRGSRAASTPPPPPPPSGRGE